VPDPISIVMHEELGVGPQPLVKKIEQRFPRHGRIMMEDRERLARDIGLRPVI
jgi:hypothetical protein